MTVHLDHLCHFLATTRFDDLPEAAVDRARLVTLDTLGAIIGGAAEPEVQALTAALATPGVASVVGATTCAEPSRAAFLNGVAGTFLELDEGNQFCRGHPAIHVFPAILAHAESNGASGSEFVRALVLGYEVGARIGIGARLRMSMHPHGTWGTVAAAVGIAALEGADAATFREVINVASTLGLATSRRTMLEGGTVRNTFAGFSNEYGLRAWSMVGAGLVGESNGLGTVWGSVASESWDDSALTDELGSRYEIARNYFKRHACCRYNHAALDALAMIRSDHTFEPDDVERLEVETYSLAVQLDDPAPINTLGAKFSVPFAIASTLVNGSSSVASFTLDAVRSARIRALSQRVSVHEDPALTARMPDFRPARVTVTLTDGRTLGAETLTNRGDTEDPYTLADLTDKFRELCARRLGVEMTEALRTAALEVDALADVREMTERLVVT